MESIRDIVVIVFSVTGTVTAVVFLIMGFKLYGPASRASEKVDRVSDDIHDAAEGARSGVRLARTAMEVVSPVVPGARLVKSTFRLAAAIPRAVRFMSRFKRPSA